LFLQFILNIYHFNNGLNSNYLTTISWSSPETGYFPPISQKLMIPLYLLGNGMETPLYFHCKATESEVEIFPIYFYILFIESA
jgi:hypothetical protein